MNRAIALLGLVALVGCTGTLSVGGDSGLHVTGALMGAAGTSSHGDVAATWGNGSIDIGPKTANINRRGVSDNLRGVLGDGLGLVLADKLLCAIPAVAAQCVFDAGVARFTGDDNARATAERLLPAN